MSLCCGFCISAQPIDDEIVQQVLSEYTPSSDSKVIQITKQSPKHLIEEVTEIMAKSFAGSKTSAPEGCLSWIQDPKASGDDPSLPLLENPSEDRVEFCRFIIKFCFKMCLPQRTCFALIKEGKVVSGCLSFPPSTKQLHRMNPLCEICLALSLGVPKVLRTKSVEIRMKAVGAEMKKAHKKCASFPHWYIWSFATDAEEQGKGYGKDMMGFMTSLADKTGQSMYLETFGPRNEQFYTKYGYQVQERMVFKTQHESLEMHGGALVMMRPSTKQ